MSTRLLLSLALALGGSALAGSYSITQSSGGNLNGLGLGTDTGNHCDDCTTGPISMPFAFTLYDQSFSSLNVSSNGVVFFVSGSNSTTGTIPNSEFGYAIFPLWMDQCTDTSCGDLQPNGFGISTHTSGAPGTQEFDIDFLTFEFGDHNATHAYEVQLFEGQTTFKVVYSGGIIPAGGSIGVQKDLDDFSVFQQGSGASTESLVHTDAAVENTTLTFALADTPEPGTYLLIGFGLAAIPVMRRISRKA